MTEGTVEPRLKLFPVQVAELETVRIDYEAFVSPAGAQPPKYFNPHQISFCPQVKYRVDDSSGVVIVSAKSVFARPTKGGAAADLSADPAPLEPYRLEVAAGAVFIFDPQKMSREEVVEWCEKGAFFIVSPYLRQLVHDVTARSGFPTVTLPLVQVPVLHGTGPASAPEK